MYFLPWHRLFNHAYEQALRNECGYKGAQPYVSFNSLHMIITYPLEEVIDHAQWEWSAGDATPGSNALFMEPGGIGGNGEVVQHEPSTIYIPTVPQTVGKIAPGTGGGCIIDGPFANFTNNIGPYGP